MTEDSRTSTGRWVVSIEANMDWEELARYDDPERAIFHWHQLEHQVHPHGPRLGRAIFDDDKGEGEPLDPDAVRDRVQGELEDDALRVLAQEKAAERQRQRLRDEEIARRNAELEAEQRRHAGGPSRPGEL
jgi:hypothetical protein